MSVREDLLSLAEGSHASKSAGGSPALPPLVKQHHGGSLYRGGVPGNKGGPGRPKDELRAKMRGALESVLDAIITAIAGERLAHDTARLVLTDPRIDALGPEAAAVLSAVLDDYCTAKLSGRELIQAHETLAKYGVGVQAEVESKVTEHRYVVRIPTRVSEVQRNAPVAVIASPQDVPTQGQSS